MKKSAIYQLFSHIPTLETERLTLRGMRVSDAEDMYAYAQHEPVTRYLTWTPHPNIKHTKEYLTYIGQRYRTGDFFDWAVICKEDGRMIGTCGFTSFDFVSDSAEIGYVLNPEYHGRGLATEAVREVLRFGFEDLSLHRIEAKFMKENTRSQMLMERVGMQFEGYAREAMKVKGQYRTIGRYGILRHEWIK
ncbi:MAG: GNAT family N-acetyltransferase [Clostridia bacterium]|nr:GNAT family N-acetyltransferase [Clostridia bacterium]